MIKDYFSMALKNLRKRRLRTWLTMLGIFVSIATIFLLISLSLGLQGAVEEQFNILGTDKIFILSATGFLAPPGSDVGVSLGEEDINVIDKIRGIKDYSYATVANAEVDFGGEIKYFMVIGIPLERLEVYTESGGWGAEYGKELEPGDLGSVMIGSLYGEGRVFDKNVAVGNKFSINGERFRVQSILKSVGNSQDDSSILMGLEDFRRLFEIPDRVDQIIVQIEEGEDIEKVSERIEKALQNSRDVTDDTQDFDLFTPEQLLESFQVILNIITVFLAGVAGISLVVGGIGIANTMYTSTIERTKEIGTMKAIGAQNKDILLIFLIEAGLLGLVGGIIGILLGMGAGKIIEFIAVNQLGTDLLRVAFPWYLIVGCLAFSFGIGAISGLVPAWQASKINVVDALRYE
jgi:putative ABC transport system permease protein